MVFLCFFFKPIPKRVPLKKDTLDVCHIYSKREQSVDLRRLNAAYDHATVTKQRKVNSWRVHNSATYKQIAHTAQVPLRPCRLSPPGEEEQARPEMPGSLSNSPQSSSIFGMRSAAASKRYLAPRCRKAR